MIVGAFIDSREPESIQKLKFGGIPAIVTQLDYGDLWASCDDGEMLIIERKTPGDLLNSIKDNRIFQQCAEMRKHSAWCYLLVCGPMTATYSGKVIAAERTTEWNWDSVQGALLSIQELGVNIVHIASEEGYEEAVIRLSRRERCKERILSPRSVSRVMTPAEQILCSLPGIGIERAQSLSEHFNGRASDAICWLTWLDTFGEVAGISNGTKQSVRRALGLNEGETLTVWTDEAAKYHEQQKQEINK